MSVEIKVPALGESVVEATVLRWVKKEGEAVSAGDVVAELETDKVNVEVASDSSGVLEKIVKGEGENVGIGDVLAVVNDKAAAPKSGDNGAQATAATPAPASPALVSESVAHASPVARKLAEERSIDLSAVKGTGPSGKITKQDVEAAAAPKVAEREPAAPPLPPLEVQRPSTSTITSTSTTPALTPEPPLPRTGEGEHGREERRRMSRRRQTIAARLVEAQHTAAMLTTFNEIDMSTVMDIRKRQKDSFKERFGVGLGFMSFFTKAVVGGLKAFPLLNAEIQGDEVVVKHYYDIGIAVSTDEGLVVPVVRDADTLTFAQIESEIAGLAGRAREGKLTLPELQGGTFTITNGGVFGSLMATPILNTPQVGILGMHKIEERPVVKDGQIVIRPMMYVALSYDHRIVDGAESVQFLVRVKQLIEDPTLLMLEG